MTEPLPVDTGVVLDIDDERFEIESLRYGNSHTITSIMLRKVGDDTRLVVGVDWLLLHPNRRVVDQGPKPNRVRPHSLSTLDLLSEAQRDILDKRIDHMRE